MDRNLAVRPAIGTGLLLLVPLVMSMLDRHRPEGDGWHWSPLDFVVMEALVFGAGISYEFIARKLGKKAHKAILGLAILLVVLVIWVELAVGGLSQLADWLTR